jgi:hypothetical protein
MDESRLRCSDAERDACADRLHVHATAGRITPAELEERLLLARAAVTRGDLLLPLDGLPEFRDAVVAPRLLRVSERERDITVSVLEAQYMNGRICQDEYNERMEIALIARTQEELRHVLSDLPKPASKLCWRASLAAHSCACQDGCFAERKSAEREGIARGGGFGTGSIEVTRQPKPPAPRVTVRAADTFPYVKRGVLNDMLCISGDFGFWGFFIVWLPFMVIFSAGWLAAMPLMGLASICTGNDAHAKRAWDWAWQDGVGRNGT